MSTANSSTLTSSFASMEIISLTFNKTLTTAETTIRNSAMGEICFINTDYSTAAGPTYTSVTTSTTLTGQISLANIEYSSPGTISSTNVYNKTVYQAI